jgi:hypothetical protein
MTTREILLAFTAVCWIGVAVDGFVHVLMGDFLVPGGFAAAFIVWAVLWRLHYPEKPAQVPVEVPVKA